jgi:hypothetical protein
VAGAASARPSLTSAPWQGPLRGATTRAGWLARRLAGWEADAARAIENDESTNVPSDLFTDARRSNDGRPGSHRQSDLWVTLEGETMIGPAADAR